MNAPLVLFIEDNPDDSTLVELALKRSGRELDVELIEDGRAACERLLGAAPLPAITFLDINLPLVNGFDVLRRLRASPKGRDAVVVVMTSSSNPDDEQTAMAAGCSAFHVKPLGFKEYIALMARILDRWLPPSEPQAAIEAARTGG